MQCDICVKRRRSGTKTEMKREMKELPKPKKMLPSYIPSQELEASSTTGKWKNKKCSKCAANNHLVKGPHFLIEKL